LDDATFATAYAAGYAMRVDQAVAFALQHFDQPQRKLAQA